MSMKNLGRSWLEFTGMNSAGDIEKVCLLTALELNMCGSIGDDMYASVWEGNVEGSEAAVRTLRRCVHKGYTTVSQLLCCVGVTVEVLNKFSEEVKYGHGTSPLAG